MYDVMDFTGDDKSWIEFAKKHKDFFVQSTERGDVPPTIIAERNGKVFAIAVAPEVDKKFAFGASHLFRTGAAADALVLILDAHIRKVDATQGDEFLENYKHGDMQRACDEEGACDAGVISDCLICHRIEKDGNITMKVLPYSYHGKGTEFKWTNNDKYKEEEMPDRVEGLIPDTLRKIMAETPYIATEGNVLAKMSNKIGFTEDRSQYHAARAVFHILMSQGFQLFDFLSFKHPEWCDAQEKAEKFLLTLAEDGSIPKVIVPIMARIIPKHIGKVTFAEEFAKVILKYKDRFREKNKDICENAQAFAEWFHQQVFLPTPPPQMGMQSDRDPPFRVKVWNGDKSEYLGEGKCIDAVTVYIVKTEDGISSSDNPEEKPWGVDEDDILELSNNPKILLDNGQIVYGCQVWWEHVDEIDENEINISWPGQ